MTISTVVDTVKSTLEQNYPLVCKTRVFDPGSASMEVLNHSGRDALPKQLIFEVKLNGTQVAITSPFITKLLPSFDLASLDVVKTSLAADIASQFQLS